MNYSRRQLEALGEPLGESVTRREGGRIIYGGGGSGGGSAPAQQTTISDLPEWAKPYAQQTLGMGQALTTTKDAQGNITGPSQYQTYGNWAKTQEGVSGERIAGFDPLQQQAYQGVAGLQASPQLDVASNISQMAAMRGLGAGYRPGQFGNQFQAPAQYQPASFDYLQAQAPQLQQFQMAGPERVSTQDYTGANVNNYMTPYMQNVVDVQQQEAKRQSDILGTQQAGEAVKAGAFGGSRAGLLEAERQRNLGTQLGQIQATGSQAAFQNAQQQFNQQQQANLQAQQLNQQAGLTTGIQNLAAQLGVQQLGAGQNMQAQLANQQANQAAQQAEEQSRQYGAGQAMTAAQQRAQYGLAGQQLGEQSRQYGAGFGLQGLSTALQGAGQLGNLGQAQFGQQQNILGMQNQFGAQQQALEQQKLSQQYQDFLNQQRYPYQQLEFMSNLLRGTPMGTVNTMYQAAPSMTSQLAGLGLAGAGMYGLANKAKGGKIKEKKPAGLAELALAKMGE